MPREVLPCCKKGDHSKCSGYQGPGSGVFGPTIQCSCSCHAKHVPDPFPKLTLKFKKVRHIKGIPKVPSKKGEKAKGKRKILSPERSDLQIRHKGVVLILGEEDFDENEYRRNLKKQGPMFRRLVKGLIKKHGKTLPKR